MIQSIGIVAAGGALGAVLRYLLAAALMPISQGFPWAIMLVNIAGCAVMGGLAGFEAFSSAMPAQLRMFLMTGVLGGFTTFSAFALDTIMLAQRGEMVRAMVYVALSVGASLAAFVAAMALVRSL